MKFENMIVGSFVERKSDGEVMLVVSQHKDGDIYLSGKNSSDCIYVEGAKLFRKTDVSEDFKKQFTVEDKTNGKIVYLHNKSNSDHLELGYHLVDTNDLSTIPLFLEGALDKGWENALNVAHPTHILAVEYNKRVDNGVMNKEEAMEIIKLLNASGVKESIAEM